MLPAAVQLCCAPLLPAAGGEAVAERGLWRREEDTQQVTAAAFETGGGELAAQPRQLTPHFATQPIAASCDDRPGWCSQAAHAMLPLGLCNLPISLPCFTGVPHSLRALDAMCNKICAK